MTQLKGASKAVTPGAKTDGVFVLGQWTANIDTSTKVTGLNWNIDSAKLKEELEASAIAAIGQVEVSRSRVAKWGEFVWTVTFVSNPCSACTTAWPDGTTGWMTPRGAGDIALFQVASDASNPLSTGSSIESNERQKGSTGLTGGFTVTVGGSAGGVAASAQHRCRPLASFCT